MKTVLTIDFDIIMKPSIQLYNNLISTENYIDNIESWNFVKYAPADLIIYNKLTNYLLTLIDSTTEIHFIENHDQILNYLEDNDKYNLINIDHHHDLGYRGNDEIAKEVIGCANWALMIAQENLLENYLWIGNSNSVQKSDSILKYDFKDIATCDLSMLEKPDIIIVCYSAQWIPQQFRPLFKLWIDLVSIKLNTSICLEGDYNGL